MGGQGDVTVLRTVVSPFALRVRMALYLKGVSYEYLEQNVFDKGELLVASNPVHKKVPVLIHGGKPVCESVAIVQYVDEFWSGAGFASILPADPYDRAVARFWAAYVDDKLVAAVLGILRAATEEERDEKVEAAHAVVAPMEEAFATCSKGKAFFSGGDSVGYLDLALGCHLFWLETLRSMFGVTVIDAGRTPQLAAWAERFLDTKAAKEVTPPTNSVEEYAGKLQAIWAAAASAK
ncbi:probable glutathione S-transferase GSTU6 [Lolium rigidum]|uniref:probable glutathione S-transferase GSTU6 n=1 Tax=Lolium rigidum TaxID=89674 RepID=UPI001F5E0567|nr:probable glutathione S-transferase GSTU6 [Lolium rigidum]